MCFKKIILFFYFTISFSIVTKGELSKDIDSLRFNGIENAIHFHQNKKALLLIDQIIDKGNKESNDTIIAKGYYFKTIVFLSENKFLLAMNNIIKANNFFEKINDSIGIANCNLQKGVILRSTKDYSKSTLFLSQAENIYNKFKLNKKTITTYLIGLNSYELGNYNEAKSSLLESKKEYLKALNYDGVNECNIWLGRVYLALNNVPESKNLFCAANYYSKKNHIPEGLVLSQIGIGQCYLAYKVYDSSKYYLQSAYDTSIQTNYAIGTKESSMALNQYYVAKKDFEKAHYFLLKYFNIQDSIYTVDNTLRIIDLQSQSEIERKENQISQLFIQQKLYRNWMIILAIIVLLGSLVIYLFYKNNRTKELLNKQLTVSNEELKQSQEQILKLQKYKESFLANITHELRTPLNAIKGISDLLSFTNNENEKNELLSGLKKSSNHLLNMVNDFLDFSKLKEGKLTLRRQPFQLHSVIKSATNLLKVNAEEKQLVYTLELRHLPETVMGDESRLIQILVNIIGNAIKFTNSGFVKVVCQGKLLNENKCEIEIKISDSGIGISPEKIKSIFEDYEQADENIAATFGGTGLGLGICKRLIEQHQGTITCESELGKGTNFTITLPYEYLKINEIEIKNLHNFDELATKKATIIIADDNEMNLLVAEKLIGKNMPLAKLLKAENGNQVLDLIEKQEVDLILMDMKMPVMNGIEATKIIRANKTIKQPHIIAMTAGTSEDDIEECYQSGMNDYLPKPYHIEVLLSKIQKIIESNT